MVAISTDITTANASAITPERLEYLKSRRRQSLIVGGARFGLALLMLAIWEVTSRQGWVDPLLISRPSTVMSTLTDLAASGELWRHTSVTLRETIIGFIVGMVAGIVIATGLWWSPTVGRILEPFLVVANALPKIALGPILYVWLGPSKSVYGMAIAVSIVVTILMVYEGFRAVDPSKVKLLRTFGASRWKVLRFVVFPGSLPALMATAKISIGLTLVGVIVGEFLSSTAGLGYLILYGSQVFQMDLVMASIVMLLVISTVMYVLAEWCERKLLRRR